MAQTTASFQQVITDDAVPGKASRLLFSKQGFFYTATSEGLFLFDGVNLNPLSQAKDSVQNITALYETVEGVLWLGSSTGKLFFYKQKAITEWKPQEGHPQKGISDFETDTYGQLWIATKGEGIYVYSNNKLYNLNTADGLSDDYVYDLYIIGTKVYAATDQGLSICSFSNGKKNVKIINTSDGLVDNIVQTITGDPQQKNKLWLGFQNGNAGMLDIVTHQYINMFNTQQAAASVQKILPLDNEIWIAANDGVSRMYRTNATIQQTFMASSLQDMAKDNEGNIWMLSSLGIHRSAGEQLQTVFTIDELDTKYVNDVIVTHDGSFWVTSKQGITCYKAQNSSYARSYIALPLKNKSDITCLFEDNNKNIWIGTMGDGVFQYNVLSKKVIQLSQPAFPAYASILSITGTNNHVWINSLEGVWKYNHSSQTAERLNTTEATGSAYIYYVMEDSKGRVWFATDGKGITVWENNRYTSFREKEGLAAKVVYAIAEDKHGAIWCNTLNNGLYRYADNRFAHFSTKDGLPDATIFSITADDKDHLFCVSAKGCFIINTTNGTVNPVMAPASGATINTNLNSSFTKGAFTWFNAGNQIYAFHEPSYKSVHLPQTEILNRQLFLDAVDMNRNVFEYNENNLSFTFAGFYYSDPANVQFRYKLDGYNNQWQATKDGYVNFPKLSPGTYTFRVRSSVTDNFENAKEAAYRFTINKPFWRTWWFLLISISAVTSILIYIIKTREAELQKIQQLQTEKLKAQYETLKNQVNPHFLFNSFNTLLNVIDEDPLKAAVYVEHLSDFYRSIVNLREKDLIPLTEELRIIENYFFIQKKRFGTALQFVNDIEIQQANLYLLPPLTLQLLAENAVKHNVVSKDRPLSFRVWINNHNLVVQNNLNLKINHEKGEGLGLQNIKNRFQLIADKEVKIEQTATDFIVSLPLIKVQ